MKCNDCNGSGISMRDYHDGTADCHLEMCKCVPANCSYCNGTGQHPYAVESDLNDRIRFYLTSDKNLAKPGLEFHWFTLYLPTQDEPKPYISLNNTYFEDPKKLKLAADLLLQAAGILEKEQREKDGQKSIQNKSRTNR
jgi:hypothetical protein